MKHIDTYIHVYPNSYMFSCLNLTSNSQTCPKLGLQVVASQYLAAQAMVGSLDQPGFLYLFLAFLDIIDLHQYIVSN